jgi:adenylate cyclase
MRVGIHTGPVVAGSVGSAERLKYTSVGDTVNVAARLENVDRDVFPAETRTRILVSEETRRLLGEDVLLQDIGPRSVPGRVQPVHVWRVLPAGDRRDPKEVGQR